MAKHRNKKIKREYSPSAQKKPIMAEEPFDSSKTVKWCFRLFDKETVWHGDNYSEETFREVAHLLKKYSDRAWGDILKDHQRDHFFSETSVLTAEAEKRLKVLGLDDFPMWSFRFTGLKRIWGIRTGRYFQVVWWDPQHKVYPINIQDRGKVRH